MHLVSFNGVTFTDLGVTSPKFDDPSSPGQDRALTAVSRISADPLPGGVETGLQTLIALFTPDQSHDTEPTLMAVLAALDLDSATPGTLVCQLLDGTLVETEATAGAWSYRSTNTLAVPFILTTPGWRAQSDTTLKAAGLVSADGSFANLNSGYRDVLPVVTVYWDGTQRASTTATFGWKHRIGSGLTVTNTGTEPLLNQPYQIGPIKTAALVTAGQMQADGDDLRVFCEGQELARTLIGINTAATFVWIILPTLAPGQSVTLDILTNNPNATNPPTLTFGEDLPGMDISGQSFTPTSASGVNIGLTGAGWETDQWKGGTAICVKNSSNSIDSIRRIVSNTATQIVLEATFANNPTGSDTIAILKSGFVGTGGIVSSGTTTTVTYSPAVMKTNEYAGAVFEYINAVGTVFTSTVVSNTATTVTFSPAISPAPSNPNTWRVYQPNGNRMWDVRQPPKTTNYPGLWQANKIQAPPTQVDFDAPGSWYRFVYQPNRDTYSQPRYDSFLVGAGDYDHVPIMHIQRSKQGKIGTQREVGLADAVGVSSPFPINGVWFGYTFRNAKKAGSGSPGEGMAEARFMVQEAGGELWSTFLSDVAVHSSTATVSPAWYDLDGSPNRIAMALIPNAADEIPANDTNTAELRSTGSYVGIMVNPSAAITESVNWFGDGTPAVVAVYDVDLILRTGGAAATRPYHRIEIGGADHRVFIAATDERIAVDCARHRVTLTEDDGTVIRAIPYALQAQAVIDDADGAATTLVSARWLPIPPETVNDDAIYYSDPSGAGWGSLGLIVTGRAGFRT